jgi:PPE-repeat protein
MLDFAALPPEINSARMYSGPGSGPMTAAAAAWDALAGQLDSFATGYSSVLGALQGENWSGPASSTMAAAATPYVQWATTTAAQAEQAASHARAAAAAYETAFAATVPPAAVAANRVQLATLVATNFFGQNAPAIAATEAAYAEMWAQDAAAMYGYAEASSPAAALTPFAKPPQTTNAAGPSAQNAAVAHAAETSTATDSHLSQVVSAVPQQLPSSSTSPGSSILTAFNGVSALAGPQDLVSTLLRTLGSGANMGIEIERAFAGAAPAVSPAATTGTAGVHGAVLAGAGKAVPVGQLSVPSSWTTSAPVANAAAAAPGPAPLQLSGSEIRGLPAGAAEPAPHTAGGAPPATLGPVENASGRRTGNTVFRMRDRRFRMPRPAVGG